MAWKKVSTYALGYDIDTKIFRFWYILEGEYIQHGLQLTPEEFVALGDMFRNEGPIWYESDTNRFGTNAEMVGEEESDG